MFNFEHHRSRVKKCLLLFLFVVIGIFIYFDYNYTAFLFTREHDPLSVVDNARLYPKHIYRQVSPLTENEIAELLKEAREKGLKISIRGSGHSQGGHIVTEGALLIDMRSFNKILSIDTNKNLLTVQAGATWDIVQRALNPHGLAVETMQSSNIFTVGGTLSANAHGRDVSTPTFVESVDSFRLMKADGDIVSVSRTENPDLFASVIGGYGLFGVILDVTIHVIPNQVLKQTVFVTTPENLVADIQTHVLENNKAEMFLARPSFVPGKLFSEIIGIVWESVPSDVSIDTTLTEEEHVIRDKFIFGLSRWSDLVKRARWRLQKDIEMGVGEERYMTRNNAMRPPLGPLLFLDYESPTRTDILQEYYVPMSKASAFITDLASILDTNDINVISTTIRYVKQNNEIVLPYAPNEDMIAVIFMANVSLKEKEQQHLKATVESILDKVLSYGGTYYLTYQLFPTREQLRTAYPRFEEFIALKKKYDGEELFSNNFYEYYR